MRRSSQSIDDQIADYELKIKQLRERKSTVQKDISSAETFIREKDQRIR